MQIARVLRGEMQTIGGCDVESFSVGDCVSLSTSRRVEARLSFAGKSPNPLSAMHVLTSTPPAAPRESTNPGRGSSLPFSLERNRTKTKEQNQRCFKEVLRPSDQMLLLFSRPILAFFTPNFAGHLDFQALNDIDTIIPVPFPRFVVTTNVSVVQGKDIIIIINMPCKMFTHCEVRHKFTTKLQEWKVYRQR